MIVRYDEFEQLLRKLDIAIVPKDTRRIRGYDVDTYRMLAKRTENIDFNCSDGDSFCRYIHVRDGACCLDCIDTCGHWQREGRMLDEDSARKMAEYCDVQEGFCREGIGCILPRELRSPVCLYHICSDAKMTGEEKALLRQLKCGIDRKEH
jgi:hypothetical protein